MAGPAALGEQEFIDHIARRVKSGRWPPVLGIGDDAAVLNLPPRSQILLTTDLLTDGVHFKRERTPGRLLGRKALAVNLSDIAAMGGLPHSCVVSIGFPRRTPASYARDLAAGLAGMARRYGVALVGGDTCAARALFVNVTLLGIVEPGRAVSRSGARVGDGLYVTGALGASAAGLELLQGSRRSAASGRRAAAGRSVETARRRAIAAHLDPQPRTTAGRALGTTGIASAMIDLSDGLSIDLPRLCNASRSGAVILRAALPVAREAALLLGGRPALERSVTGGEDYELLFAAPPGCEPLVEGLSRRLGLPMTRIGQIVPRREGVSMLDAEGYYRPLPKGRFEHFPRRRR